MLHMNIAAKFATQWTYFLIIWRSYMKSNIAAKFQPNITYLNQDIEVFVKIAFFVKKKCGPLFLNMLIRNASKGG